MTGIRLKPKKPFDGISLKPLIFIDNPDWENRLIYSYWKGRFSVRSQDYRLDKDNMLFDMVNDPNQTINIGETQPKILEKLIVAKRKWEKDVLVELPKKRY